MKGCFSAWVAWLVVLVAVPGAQAAELQTTTTPYPGITHSVYLDMAAPARIHVVEVDLSSSEISLHATTEAERGSKVSEYASASGAQVVINGDFFSAVDFAPAGLAMGSAQLWSGAEDDEVSGFLSFDRNGDRSHVMISPPADVVAADGLPVGTQGVVGGRPLLVRIGVAQSQFNCGDTIAMPCERAPRSAAAVSADGNTLWLVVVDGWQAGSVGLTAAELGDFLVTVGASDAIMFDGGGASALHIAGEGGIVSAPSDGVERDVANHLGVRHGALPQGTLVGLIRERDIFDDMANIDGATVLLDDGQMDVTGADGQYSFNVTPRYACATASKAGYHSATRCNQVVPMDVTFNSIALFPNSDFIDAAPGTPDAGRADAGGNFPDAGGQPRDGAPGADAGDGGGGDGCCTVARPHGGPNGGNLLLMFLAAWPIVRRRRDSRHE